MYVNRGASSLLPSFDAPYSFPLPSFFFLFPSRPEILFVPGLRGERWPRIGVRGAGCEPSLHRDERGGGECYEGSVSGYEPCSTPASGVGANGTVNARREEKQQGRVETTGR